MRQYAVCLGLLDAGQARPRRARPVGSRRALGGATWRWAGWIQGLFRGDTTQCPCLLRTTTPQATGLAVTLALWGMRRVRQGGLSSPAVCACAGEAARRPHGRVGAPGCRTRRSEAGVCARAAQGQPTLPSPDCAWRLAHTSQGGVARTAGRGPRVGARARRWWWACWAAPTCRSSASPTRTARPARPSARAAAARARSSTPRAAAARLSARWQVPRPAHGCLVGGRPTRRPTAPGPRDPAAAGSSRDGLVGGQAPGALRRRHADAAPAGAARRRQRLHETPAVHFSELRPAGAGRNSRGARVGGRPAQRLALEDSADFGGVRFMESYESRHSDHSFTGRLAARLGVTRPPLRIDSQAKYGAARCLLAASCVRARAKSGWLRREDGAHWARHARAFLPEGCAPWVPARAA